MMKAISLGFDMDRAYKEKASARMSAKEEKTPAEKRGSIRRRRQNTAVDATAMPNILEYLGYTLCPGTSVFGPWVTYEEYHQIFLKPVWVSIVKEVHS